MKVVENIATKRSTIHGQFFTSSRSSSSRLVFCWGGGVTRSFVFAKVIQNIRIEATPKMAMVYWKPITSLPPPSAFTNGRTSRVISNPPPNAPTKRKLDATVRVRDDGLITPKSEEYG